MQRYAIGLAFAAAAVVLRAAVDPYLGDHLPLAPVYGAVALAVWVCGPGPAVLTAIAGYLALDFLFVAPRGVPTPIDARVVATLTVHAVSSALIIAIGTRMRRAENGLRDHVAALRQADRRKDEFLATLAHELRNPLAPIRTAVEILRLKEPANSALHAPRDIIDRQVRHLTRLVDDLLDASRISQGKVQLRRERIDVAAAVAPAVEAARPLFDASRHEFSMVMPPEPLLVDADPTRLTQIILNLLNNAAKFTPEGGRIELHVARREDRAEIRVRDSGIGLDANGIAQLFQMFSQVAPMEDRLNAGLGIGLALVRGFVELHGGHVTARSDGPGRGAEFIVSLPAVAAATAPAATRAAAVDAGA